MKDKPNVKLKLKVHFNAQFKVGVNANVHGCVKVNGQVNVKG